MKDLKQFANFNIIPQVTELLVLCKTAYCISISSKITMQNDTTVSLPQFIEASFLHR